MAGRVRLVDIARAAEVTTTTASLALNGRPGVSETTRSRIQALARDMGYSPHHGARALARGRSGLWGAWVSGPEEHWSRWLSGVLTQASSSVLVSRVPSSDRRRDMARQAATEARLDGCLVFDPDGDDAGLQPLLDHGVPTVVAGRRSRWFDCVEIHERPAFDQLLARLAKVERAMALVATRGQIQRDDPLVRFWQSADVDPRRILVAIPDDTPEHGATAARELMARGTLPGSALVAAGDRAAAGMIRAFRAAGVAVPGDVSIAGWGDLPFSSWLEPTLTTVALPLEEAGIRSVLTLSARIGRAEMPRVRRTLDARIVVRSSG